LSAAALSGAFALTPERSHQKPSARRSCTSQGFRERGIYGSSYTVKHDIQIEDLLFRVEHVIRSEIDVIRNQLARNRIELIEATASFVDAHHLALDDGSGDERIIQTSHVVIACGTNATRDPHITFDGQRSW
jgi:NAD(P) transhydrogenase